MNHHLLHLDANYAAHGTVVCVFRRKVLVPTQIYISERSSDQRAAPSSLAKERKMGRLAQTEGLTEFGQDLLATV